MISPDPVFSQLDSIERIKAHIDRRIEVIRRNGVRECTAIWLIEDLIALKIAMQRKREKEK